MLEHKLCMKCFQVGGYIVPAGANGGYNKLPRKVNVKWGLLICNNKHSSLLPISKDDLSHEQIVMTVVSSHKMSEYEL